MVVPFPAMVLLAFSHLRRVEREENTVEDAHPAEDV